MQWINFIDVETDNVVSIRYNFQNELNQIEWVCDNLSRVRNMKNFQT